MAPTSYTDPTSFKSYPKDLPGRYHSISDYHELYTSGKTTPLAVAKAILPLIRRDVKPLSQHSNSFISTNQWVHPGFCLIRSKTYLLVLDRRSRSSTQSYSLVRVCAIVHCTLGYRRGILDNQEYSRWLRILFTGCIADNGENFYSLLLKSPRSVYKIYILTTPAGHLSYKQPRLQLFAIRRVYLSVSWMEFPLQSKMNVMWKPTLQPLDERWTKSCPKFKTKVLGQFSDGLRLELLF